MPKNMKKSASPKKQHQPDMGAYMKKSTAGVIAAICLVVGFYLNTVISGLTEPAPQQGFVAQMPSVAPGQSGQPPAPQIDQETARRIGAQQQALVNDPEDADGWAALGHLYFDSNQPSKAIEAYTTSLELAPGDPDVLTDLGVMYRRNGQPQQALEAFGRAVAANPGHEIARFNSGIVLMHDLNNLSGAMAAWQELLAVNPAATAPNGTPVRQLVDELAQKTGAAPGSTPLPAPRGGPRLLPPAQ